MCYQQLMRWTPGGVSSDIEDRRGSSGGFGFGGAPIGIGAAVVLLILSLLFGRNFFTLVGGGAPATQESPAARPVAETAEERKEVQFVSFVLDDAQTTWESTLPQQAGQPYRHARLVLF